MNLLTRITMQGLTAAHATVRELRGSPAVAARFGDSETQVEFIDEPHLIRQLLTDALAQLDAIEAGQ